LAESVRQQSRHPLKSDPQDCKATGLNLFA
jgi:hypothetical protein